VQKTTDLVRVINALPGYSTLWGFKENSSESCLQESGTLILLLISGEVLKRPGKKKYRVRLEEKNGAVMNTRDSADIPKEYRIMGISGKYRYEEQCTANGISSIGKIFIFVLRPFPVLNIITI